MMKKTMQAAILSIITCAMAHADDGFTPNEVKLNQQIQEQIKALQSQQQEQIQKLNTQFEAQISKVQADLEKQIQTANNQIQDQLKQIQSQINKSS